MNKQTIRKIGDNTKKTYIMLLNKLKRNNININKINFLQIENFFKTQQSSISAMTTYYSALLWYHKMNNNISIVDEIKKKLIFISKIKNKTIKTNNQTIEWNKILMIYKKMKNIINNNKEYYEKYNKIFAIISIYILHPTRLIEDISEMYYLKNNNENISDDCILWTNKKIQNMDKYNENKIKNTTIKDNKNYYVKNKKGTFFVFNNYKTKGTYGKQIIEVRNNLVNIIDKYVSFNNIKNGSSLFNIGDKNLIQKMQNIFHMACGINISVNYLRNSFIKYILSKNINNNSKIYFSKLMALDITKI
jgi:hypothetical protein